MFPGTSLGVSLELFIPLGRAHVPGSLLLFPLSQASFLQLTKLFCLLESLPSPLPCRAAGLTAGAPHSQEGLICSGLENTPVKAAGAHDCFGGNLESPSSPSAPNSPAPSLISLAPNFCFIRQIPYLPLLPYFGVTSKLPPSDFSSGVLYGFRLC